jgi:hypothetical protein
VDRRLHLEFVEDLPTDVGDPQGIQRDGPASYSSLFLKVIRMSNMDELKKEIEQGISFNKVCADELKAREEEKKKRAEELAKLKEKLKAEGKWTEDE